MREDGEDDEKGMVSDIEDVWSLGGREMSSFVRDGICVCMAVVVVAVVVVLVVALMVAMEVVVLMVVLMVGE